ncbi:conserved hypothetical protein, partial [Ricinus communis]
RSLHCPGHHVLRAGRERAAQTGAVEPVALVVVGERAAAVEAGGDTRLAGVQLPGVISAGAAPAAIEAEPGVAAFEAGQREGQVASAFAQLGYGEPPVGTAQARLAIAQVARLQRAAQRRRRQRAGDIDTGAQSAAESCIELRQLRRIELYLQARGIAQRAAGRESVGAGRQRQLRNLPVREVGRFGAQRSGQRQLGEAAADVRERDAQAERLAEPAGHLERRRDVRVEAVRPRRQWQRVDIAPALPAGGVEGQRARAAHAALRQCQRQLRRQRAALQRHGSAQRAIAVAPVMQLRMQLAVELFKRAGGLQLGAAHGQHIDADIALDRRGETGLQRERQMVVERAQCGIGLDGEKSGQVGVERQRAQRAAGSCGQWPGQVGAGDGALQRQWIVAAEADAAALGDQRQ